jgi:hypothetical protein
MSRLVALYPFRFIDPASGKRVQARDKASLADIAARHERWQVTGDAELRKGEGDTFKPWNALPWRTGPLPSDPEPDLNPEIDDAERFLAMRVLRRYVTYCARRGRWKSMNAAAGLYRKLERAL